MPSIKISDVALDYQLIEGDPDLATLVFLHEGLGSVELWRDFPGWVARETGHPALVYSRHGHGWSDPLTGPRSARFMHHEALVTLPLLLDRLAMDRPLLIGHSDGASIALIHAGEGGREVEAIVAIAPHVFVEPESLAGTAAARQAFEESDLAEKMAKYHRDPSGTFFGWYDIWNSAEFRDWNIEHDIAGIDRPILLIQGADDQYGTGAQLDAIESRVAGQVERLWLTECGHSPHLDRPEVTLAATVGFIRRHATR